VDGTDVLQILSLGALPGEELLVEASGEEADAAVAALAQLFQNRFGEDLANENPPTQPRTRPMADGDW